MKNSLFSRRTFLKTIIAIAGAGIVSKFPAGISKAFAAVTQKSNSKLTVITGKDLSKQTIEKMTDQAFTALGGINKFIKKGMNVVVKPNIAWNSAPERAHNTNPYLVEAVVRRCVKAGAKVTVFDNTCNSAQLTYRSTGIAEAVKAAGADIEFCDSRKFIDVNVPNGLFNKTLKVYKPITEADFVINMPIAKHHGSSELSLSMKNLMGAVGGNRGFFHQSLHESIVDFTKAVKCDLVICDATRILTNHGPNGGTDADVKELRTIIVGTNPVTVDAYATTLFGKKPSDIKYIALAAKENMGEINLSNIQINKVQA